MFSVSEGFADLPVVIPCGNCDGCRLERSRQWAIRCMHEASLYERNCFVTLTYDEGHLPAGSTLVKHKGKCDCDGMCKTFAGFMKRLRRRFPGERPRYYHCGEYGSEFGRPHYHACLFNFEFEDKYQWAVRQGFPVWRSPVLEALWPFGQSELGSVTFESAAYVARYIMKKHLGPNAWMRYQVVDLETGETSDRVPEYTTMSRRPGIGRPWFDVFGKEVYPSDEVIVRGRSMKPPRYYDLQHELVNASEALEVARARRRSRRLEDETPERLEVREKCTRARLARKTRELE